MQGLRIGNADENEKINVRVIEAATVQDLVDQGVLDLKTIAVYLLWKDLQPK